MIIDIHVHPPAATLPREERLETFERMLDAGRRAGIDKQVLVGTRGPGSDEWTRELVERYPDLFDGWSEMDFDELHSQFGQGGALTAEGTLAIARRMNHNRQVHEQLALLLESSQAKTISDIVDVMYRQVAAAAAHCHEKPREKPGHTNSG